MPDASRLFLELYEVMKPGALLLVAEPRGHVSVDDWGETIAAAEERGFVVVARPAVARSRTALLERK